MRVMASRNKIRKKECKEKKNKKNKIILYSISFLKYYFPKSKANK